MLVSSCCRELMGLCRESQYLHSAMPFKYGVHEKCGVRLVYSFSIQYDDGFDTVTPKSAAGARTAR